MAILWQIVVVVFEGNAVADGRLGMLVAGYLVA